MRLRIQIPRLLLLLSIARLAPCHAADAEITAVFASVQDDYRRTKQADGSFRPEYYAFGEGGCVRSATRDASLDGLSFKTIAHTLAPALARQNFLGTADPAKADLLLMVYWGETAPDNRAAAGYATGPASVAPPPPPPRVITFGARRVYVPTSAPPRPQSTLPDQGAFDTATSAQNLARDRANRANAQLLGYGEALERAETRPTSASADDLRDELEDPRYFVIVQAFDFRKMWKEKQPALRWEIRFSIRARAHGFDEALTAMTQAAARYFGQPSRGLVRKSAPIGEVLLGEPEYREYFDAEKK